MRLQTEAIVLRATKYSESDVILNIYTQKYGKMGVYAKNARRLKSPLMSSAQIFAHSSMMISTYDGRFRLTKSDLINNNYHITAEFERINLGYYYLQFVEKISLEGEANIKLFNLLRTALEVLQQNNNYFLQKITFDMKVIEIFGYKPVVDRCASCGKFNDIGNVTDIPSGGRICAICAGEHPASIVEKLDSTSYKLMDFIQKNNYKVIMDARVNESILKEVNLFLNKFIDYHFENMEISTRKYLNY